MTLERLGGRFRFKQKGRKLKFKKSRDQTEYRADDLGDSRGYRLKQQKGQKIKKREEKKIVIKLRIELRTLSVNLVKDT